MSNEKEPSANFVSEPRKIGRLPLGHFVELADGTQKRLPATMLRPLTWQEAMLHRPATTEDIIGAEETIRQADELMQLRKQFEKNDCETFEGDEDTL